METLQWLLSEITQFLANLFFSLLAYGLTFALIGLAIGIVLVIIAGRSGAFRRPNSLWQMLAGLNYVYIPLLLTVMGGFWGTIYGAHTCADRFIADSAKPLAQYGQTYMNLAFSMAPEIPWERHQGRSLDEILAEEMAQRMGTVPGSKAHQYFSEVNKAVVAHTLREAGISSSLRDPRTVMLTLKNKRLPSNAFIGFPRTLHQHCDAFFSVKYNWMLWLFLPFLLLPFAEYLIFRLVGRRSNYQQPKPSVQVSALVEAMPMTMPLKSEASAVLAVRSFTDSVDSEPNSDELTENKEVLGEQSVPPVPKEVLGEQSVPPVQPEASNIERREATAAVPTITPHTVPQTRNPLTQTSNIQTSNSMKQQTSSTAITYILGGALLQMYAGIGSGWMSVIIAIFGFVIFYIGLDKLKFGLDQTGQSAASMLKLAAIVGAISAFVDLIPLLGILASLGYTAAFVIELVGFLKLKNSDTVGVSGKSGASLLLIAMILAVVQSLIGLLPFVGGYLAAPLGLAALMLVFFGWIRVQEGLFEGGQ